MTTHILAIDQGTTSSRAIIFDSSGSIIGTAQKEFTQYYPKEGWVEHDAEEIWQTSLDMCRKALKNANIKATEIAAIGITNQRETTVIWDRNTGKAIHKAIVWQDRRTADICAKMRENNVIEEMLSQKTGLLLDPYFSASKIAWILDNVKGAREGAEKGELAFGTIETWLLWKLTKGKSHFTDISNAARTSLFNIHNKEWDDELLELFNVPKSILPEVKENLADFGKTATDLLGTSIPISAMAGDQQAASFGQACFDVGMVKCTYGTGCFALVNTGSTAVASKNKLLTTIAWQIDNQINYAIEGSIFVAGAAMQWLRDKLKIIDNAPESEAIAANLDNSGGIYLVPAFAGLGAPYWDAKARAVISGMTLDTSREHIIRAALEAMAYQTRDLFEAMNADMLSSDDKNLTPIKSLRVDGGMVKNNWMCQFLADILQIPVERPVIQETTALGVAYMAGLHIGIYKNETEISKRWQLDKKFKPNMPKEKADNLYKGWLRAVSLAKTENMDRL